MIKRITNSRQFYKKQAKRNRRNQNILDIVLGVEQITLFIINISEIITDFIMLLAAVGTIASLLTSDAATASMFTKLVVCSWIVKAYFKLAYNVFADDLKQNGRKLLDQGYTPKEIYEKLDQLIKKVINYAKEIKSIIK